MSYDLGIGSAAQRLNPPHPREQNLSLRVLPRVTVTRKKLSPDFHFTF